MASTFPQVGVEAVIKGMGTFRGDAKEVETLLKNLGVGAQNASRSTGTLGTSMGSLGGFLGGVAQIAMGIISADIFRAMASGIRDLGSASLEAAGQLQLLELRATTLLAREMKGLNDTEAFAQSMRDSGIATDYQVRRFTALRDELDYVNRRMEELAEAGKTNTSTYAAFQTRADNLSGWLRETIPQWEELTDVEQAQAFGTLTMQDALIAAQGPAEELLTWAKTFGVQSPFQIEQISKAQALAMAMGFTSDQSKQLTQSVADFSSGMGLSDDVMIRIIHNFGQMLAAGKVTGTELRDLARGAMVPVNDILRRMQENMGMTNMAFADFKAAAGKGEYGVEGFVEAFQQIVEEDFAGATERMSRAWPAVTKNLKEFFTTIMGASALGPSLDIVSGGLYDILQVLITPQAIADFEALGVTIGTIVQDIFDLMGIDLEGSTIATSLHNFTTGLMKAYAPIHGFLSVLKGETPLGDWLSRLFPEVDFSWLFTGIDKIKGAFEKFQTFWDQNGPLIEQSIGKVFAALAGEGQEAGLDVWTIITDSISRFGQWLIDNGPALAQAISNIADMLATRVIPALGDLFDLLGPIVTMLGGFFGDVLTSMLDAGESGDMSDIWFGIIKAAWDNVITRLPEIFGGFVYAVATLMGGPEFADQIATAWEQAIFLALNTLMTAATAASQLLTLGLFYAGEFANGVRDFFSQGLGAWPGVVENLIAIGTEMMNKIKQGFTDAFETFRTDVLTAWTKFINDLIALAKGLFEFGSPSRVTFEMGRNIMLGLQKGIVKTAMAPERAMLQAMSGTLSAAMTAAPAIPAPQGYGGITKTDARSVQVGRVDINNGMQMEQFDQMMRQWLGA